MDVLDTLLRMINKGLADGTLVAASGVDESTVNDFLLHVVMKWDWRDGSEQLGVLRDVEAGILFSVNQSRVGTAWDAVHDCLPVCPMTQEMACAVAIRSRDKLGVTMFSAAGWASLSTRPASKLADGRQVKDITAEDMLLVHGCGDSVFPDRPVLVQSESALAGEAVKQTWLPALLEALCQRQTVALRKALRKAAMQIDSLKRQSPDEQERELKRLRTEAEDLRTVAKDLRAQITSYAVNLTDDD